MGDEAGVTLVRRGKGRADTSGKAQFISPHSTAWSLANNRYHYETVGGINAAEQENIIINNFISINTVFQGVAFTVEVSE